MMSYEIGKLINLGPQDNKTNSVNDAIEMLDKKKTYYWLEKQNDVKFDILLINKIFDALEDMEKRTTGHGKK